MHNILQCLFSNGFVPIVFKLNIPQTLQRIYALVDLEALQAISELFTTTKTQKFPFPESVQQVCNDL